MITVLFIIIIIVLDKALLSAYYVLTTLHALIHLTIAIMLWKNFHLTDGEMRLCVVSLIYKVVNGGNRIQIQACLPLHYSVHLPKVYGVPCSRT